MQIFYPKYAFFISIYAMIFTIIGTSIAKLLDTYFPSYVKNKKKYIIFVEILLQISFNCVLFYAMREYTHALFIAFNFLKRHIYGNPAKFASLIISPTVFLAQPNLIKKIAYLWSIEK